MWIVKQLINGGCLFLGVGFKIKSEIFLGNLVLSTELIK